MSPLPPDSTARAKIEYSTCGINHVVQIRFKAPATATDVYAAFTNFVEAISPCVYGSSSVGMNVAASGSNVFLPFDDFEPISWGSSGAGAREYGADYLDLVGRGGSGHRVRLALFGAHFVVVNNKYRALEGEVASVNDALSIVRGEANIFIDINGFKPGWKGYANLGTNAYWRNKIR